MEYDTYTSGLGTGPSVVYAMNDGSDHNLSLIPSGLNDAGFVVGQSMADHNKGAWWPSSGSVKDFKDGFYPNAVNKAMQRRTSGLPVGRRCIFMRTRILLPLI